MSFLIAVDNDRAFLYDYTPERHSQLQQSEDWDNNISVCTLPRALQIGFAPSTPDGDRRHWTDWTIGGMIVKPYMDHVKRWLEQELTDEYRLDVNVGEVRRNDIENEHINEYRLDFYLLVRTNVTDTVNPVVTDFGIEARRCSAHVFDQHCESLTSYLFHLPNRIDFQIWDNMGRRVGLYTMEECDEMEKPDGLILVKLAPSTGVWKTLRSMVGDLSHRVELREKHLSQEGRELDMAWAMVSHRRLGAASLASGLSDDVISMILGRAEWDNPLLDLLVFSYSSVLVAI
jgi:hypothetical protein